MKTPLIVTFFVVAIFALAVYFYVQKQDDESVMIPNQTQNDIGSGEVPPNSDVDALRVGGSSFSDPKGLYTFLYPSDYKLDTSDPLHTRVFKNGPSARPQSEMSDGTLMVFFPINLEGQTLEEFVDESIKQRTTDGTSEITQPKKAVVLNSYSGFSYEVRGLGESTNVFIQKDPTSTQALLITYLVADPDGKNYQQDVDSVLSTIELRK